MPARILVSRDMAILAMLRHGQEPVSGVSTFLPAAVRVGRIIELEIGNPQRGFPTCRKSANFPLGSTIAYMVG